MMATDSMSRKFPSETKNVLHKKEKTSRDANIAN